MYYANGTMCARCRIKVDPDRDCLGESGIYSPNRAFTLCEPCFIEEDVETCGDRGNNLPERIELYKANLRLGSLPFRMPVPPLDSPQHPSTVQHGGDK
jgi:hypothetical protein